ncbi:hypothetical protein ACPA9J_10075 [Pseudomonas aeruginosa]
MESDQAIRRKLSAMWKWDMAARKDWSIVFMVRPWTSPTSSSTGRSSGGCP